MIDLNLLQNLEATFTLHERSNYDENREIRDITGEIVLRDEDNKSIKVSKVSAYKIRANDYNFLKFDSESGDLAEVASGIEIFIASKRIYDENFIILDKFSVSKDFRQKGIGKWTLSKFIHNMTGKDDIIFLNPSPFEIYKPINPDTESLKSYENKVCKLQKKLKSFYKSLGFKEISDTGILYFYCSEKLILGNKLLKTMPERFFNVSPLENR